LHAELRRDAKLVTEDDLRAIGAARREVAVRTLARIGDEGSFDALSKALVSEEHAIVGWAAFGIGQLCRAREPEAVRRLVLRATTLVGDTASPARDEALAAIALALGRCGSGAGPAVAQALAARRQHHRGPARRGRQAAERRVFSSAREPAEPR
jgi:hypothetical protein